jgi:hypothetical protein
MTQKTLDVLIEKWEPILENDKVESIEESYKKKVTAQLLENQEQSLMEASEPTNSVGAGGVQNYDPILISLVRRMAPKLIAFDLMGLQPMRGPTGLIFAMKSHYAGQANPPPAPVGGEALFDEADTSHSGAGTHNGNDPFDPAYSTGTGMPTADAEGSNWNEMAFSIEKTSVEATARQLRASYSIELAQDLKAIHGLDADNELASILSTEIIAEINREVVRTIYTIAKLGAEGATTPGTIDVDVDTDGRWSAEKFKGLIFQIERDANRIAVETRRGKGNVLLCSADVASALAMAGVLDYAPALNNGSQLDVDPAGATYVGNYRGKYKVFVDPYAVGNFYVVGYKGASQYDAGAFYCPYVPLQMFRATAQETFQPIIGFKTRYGMVANPFTTLNAGQNVYYRKVKVTNLI